MESAEQSAASSHSMPVMCEVFVKVEPEWGEYGPGEAPRCVLYADHDVKDESMVFGPEIVQQQDAISPMQNVVVKQETYLTYPCKLEPPDGIKVEPGCYVSPRDEHSSISLKQNFKLRSCFVRLERIPLNNLLSNITCSTAGYNQEKPANVSVTQSHKPISQMGDKVYTCSICNKTCSRQSDLTRHIRIHTGEKPYSCDACQKRFTDQSRLARHKRTHTNKKLHPCKKCDEQFVKESDLKKHALTHMGERPHSCSICYKKFAKQSDLVRHIRIHTGEKPYSCETCHKRFTDQSRLSRHLKVHNGMKSHTCDICHKRFIQRSHLTRHILIHTGEKPFSCDICQKRFNQKASLICHIRTHTGEKPFVCHVCQKKFVEKVHLIRHLQVHENDKTFTVNRDTQQSTSLKIDSDSPLLKIHKIGLV